MTINSPTQKDIFTRNANDLISSYNTGKLPNEQVNPNLKGNIENAIVYAYSQESFANYKKMEFLINQLFLQTANDTYLVNLANEIGITRNVATISSGNITIIGNSGIIIPNGTNFNGSDGSIYISQEVKTTTTQAFNIISLSRVGNVVTAQTSGEHTFAIGMSLTIAGAVETDYNGVFAITGISNNDKFTYNITTTPTTPATGVISASYIGTNLKVNSQDKGAHTNLPSGSRLNFASIIAGIESQVYIDFNGIEGGADQESIDNFRARAIKKKQNPAPPFSKSNIENIVLSITGNTRAWVYPITPAVGQVSIYFTRDNDISIIPNATEVSNTKAKIVEVAPVNTAEDDIIVLAPTSVNVNITFSSLVPNDTTMQSAITNTLQDYFTTQNEVGVNLTLDKIKSVISNVIDDNGRTPTSFALSSPVSDVIVNAGEIPLLGTLIF